MSLSVTQYGFYFNQARCNACFTCSVACKTWNKLQAGPEKWARVFKWYSGTFADVRIHTLFAPCYHCQNPVCVDAAGGAMFKEAKYGVVLIDPAEATNSSLRDAWNACPYGAIQFESNSPTSKASKCTMCIDRLEKGLLPMCVASCPQRALDFGKLSDLQAKYGSNAQLEGMPDPNTVNPSVIFNPMDSRRQLVPYDAQTALALLATSPNGKTKIFNSPDDLTDIPEGTVRRNKLVMKPTSVEDFMYLTRSDND